MQREISKRAAVFIVASFPFVALFIGTTKDLSDEVRAGLAFPFLAAGLLVSLADIISAKDRIRWQTVTSALLSIAGAVVLGFHSIANAKAHSGLFALILTTSVTVMIVSCQWPPPTSSSSAGEEFPYRS
jgi:peptidoglycan/LPS O-acetylase OafA/YrhL